MRASTDTESLNQDAAALVVSLHYAAESTEKERKAAHAAAVQWLQRSPRHVDAFMHADNEFCDLAQLDPSRKIDIDRLVKLHNTSLLIRAGNDTPTGNPIVRKPRRSTLAVAASVAVITFVSILWAQYEHTHVFATALGEQRSIQLPDGSAMILNTDSKVRIAFGADVREAWLTRGEALFTVEHEASRPFIVKTSHASIRVVGTKFDVYERPGGVTAVTVLEGAVSLSSDKPLGVGTSSAETSPLLSSSNSTPDRALLAAGQQAVITANTLRKSNATDTADTLAWRDRLLVFHEKPLTDVAAEFNRYNKRQIVIRDTDLGTRLMSGTYSLDKPQNLILYLEEDSSVSVAEDGESWIVAKSK